MTDLAKPSSSWNLAFRFNAWAAQPIAGRLMNQRSVAQMDIDGHNEFAEGEQSTREAKRAERRETTKRISEEPICSSKTAAEMDILGLTYVSVCPAVFFNTPLYFSTH